MFGLLVASITGVLTSPPDAVHGINHDYHAVWQQRVTKQKSTPAHTAPVCFTGALLYRVVWELSDGKGQRCAWR